MKKYKKNDPRLKELNQRRHHPKVALVMDWLTTVGGAERVLLKFHQMYPEAPIYTSQYDPKGISWFRDADVRTGWLQKFSPKLRRFLGPLRQKYFSSLDLSDYDVVISVTGAEAKSVITKKPEKRDADGKILPRVGAFHLCFCHAPTQYYWGKYEEYLKHPGFGILNPLVRFFLKILVKPLRRADLLAAKSPNIDQFVTISEYEKRQIKHFYRRKAIVVAPPVDVADFRKNMHNLVVVREKLGKNGVNLAGRPDYDEKEWARVLKNLPEREDFFITTSRQVTWKRLDLAVKACLKTGEQLILIGEGAEHEKLKKMAGDSYKIQFLPTMEKEALVTYLWRAKGFLFPSEEPFGMAPVEALAAGCPVIAFDRGGSRDFIIDGENGVFFDKQSVSSLTEAILRFKTIDFDEEKVVASAEKFGPKEFEQKIQRIVKFGVNEGAGKRVRYGERIEMKGGSSGGMSQRPGKNVAKRKNVNKRGKND